MSATTAAKTIRLLSLTGSTNLKVDPRVSLGLPFSYIAPNCDYLPTSYYTIVGDWGIATLNETSG